MSQQSTAVHNAKSGNMFKHPVGALIFGLFLLFGALWVVSIDVTATEGWFQGWPATSLTIAPHFGVFGQWIDFFQGNLSGLRFEADAFAWLIELFQFILSGLEDMLEKGSSRVLKWVLYIGMTGTTVLNAIANLIYNSAANAWQQTAFGIAVSLGSIGLVYLSMHLIIHRGIVGFIRMARP